jgi:Protein of unknown function (DUF2009)
VDSFNSAAPRVSRMMHTILNRAQQKVGSWVGSSVIHLGDHVSCIDVRMYLML